MKKMQTRAAIFAALTLGALVFAGCSNPVSFGPPQTGEGSPDIPAGYGTVRVSLTQGAARTIMPEPVLGDLHLKYWFTKDSEEPEERSPENGVFILESGTYTLEVKAYVDPAKTELAADGTSDPFTITSGENQGKVYVTLRPIVSQGTGSLAFSLTYPAGGVVEYLTLTQIAGSGTIDLTTDVTPSGADPVVFSGEKTGIASGYYRLNVRIKDGDGAYAGISETAHIYQNLSAQAVYVFTAGDFSLHTVTYSIGAGSGTPPASIALNGGAIITLPGSGDMTPPDGKLFIGWSDGAGLYWAGASYTISGNVTLTAQWDLTAPGYLEAYLDHAEGGDSAADPIHLPVNMVLGDGGWDALLAALAAARKYVALDLSDSTLSGAAEEAEPDMQSMGPLSLTDTAWEFDPGAANSGEQYIVSLVLPGTVTGIKAGTSSVPTFKHFTALAGVSGMGVTTVGNYAFTGTPLAAVNLPAAESIGDRAFADCASLEELTLTAATSIGLRAFSNCTSLEELNLPAATSIGDRAFKDCTSLAAVNLPAATEIGAYAFSGCASLAEVNLPAATATSIGAYAFSGCTSLTEVNFPAATPIGEHAFSGCTSLTTVSLPAATSIGASAFSGCTSLATVSFQAAESIGAAAFSGCTSLTTVSLPATLTTIDGNPFAGCGKLTTFTVDPGNTAFKAQNGMLLNKAGSTLIAYPTATGKVTLPAVTAIGNSAFYGCTSLTEVNFTAAGSVGDSAFYGCTALVTANVPAASSIGDSAFYGCTALVTANVPAASSIGNHAFRGCTSLAAVDLTAAASIGAAAFYQCIALTEVNLEAATFIGDYAFSTCTSLVEVNLPAVETIGAYVFEKCKSLAKLTFPEDQPPTVGSNTFNDITKAQTVTVKVFAADVTAYDSAWRTAFKGGNAKITLIVQAQYDDPVVDVTLWANEDGDIHSTTDMTISKTASDSFTVTVDGAYTVTQWQVNGVPLSSVANPLIIAAADYLAGKTYTLGVEVTKNGVPYSTNIRFTVED